MSFKYCKSCGHKNEFLAMEPKFCSNCGAPMDGSQSQASPQREVQQKKKIDKEPLSDYESDSNFVPEIGKLQYEVSSFEKKTFKVEDLLNLPEDEEKKR